MANLYESNSIQNAESVDQASGSLNDVMLSILKIGWPVILVIVLASLATAFRQNTKDSRGGGGKKGGGGGH